MTSYTYNFQLNDIEMRTLSAVLNLLIEDSNEKIANTTDNLDSSVFQDRIRIANSILLKAVHGADQKSGNNFWDDL